MVNGSYVKVSKRDFENKSDILYTYDSSEIDYLVNRKIIEKNEEQVTEEGGVSFIDDCDNEDLDISNI